MAFKFFNIGKANEEITALETRIAELTAENASLKDNAPLIEAAAEKLKTELADTQAKLTQVEADLATSKQSLASVSAEKARVAAELAEAAGKLANPGEQIKQAASAQAAQITASIGVEPVPTQPSSAVGGGRPTVSRDDFNNMSHSSRNQFIRNGGTVSG